MSAGRLKPTPKADLFSQFESMMTPWEGDRSLAVAVSGGADSMALLALTHDWCQRHNLSLWGLTVDHHLRPESTQEAQHVKQWATSLGIPHVILDWVPPSEKVTQDQARKARFALMIEWCNKNKIPLLLTAHHKEDQAETILMRLLKGSGMRGLRGISASRQQGGITIGRPLLDVSKHELRDYLQSNNIPWVEDSSNTSSRYLRTRLRQFLSDEEIQPNHLLRTGQKISAAQDYIDTQVRAWLKEHGHIAESGFAQLDITAFQKAHPFLQTSILTDLLMCISGAIYPPRSNSVVTLVSNIGPTMAGCTLHGCWVGRWQKKLLIVREEKAISPPIFLEEGRPIIWDGRFEVQAQQSGLSIGKLGMDNWCSIKKDIGLLLGLINPTIVKPTLPAVFRGSKLIAVPHLNFGERDGLESIHFLGKDLVQVTT